MISQRCPKCGSNRIRRGYRPTPLWSKTLFRYHLLCDGCNWEFTGFAVPGTTSYQPRRKKEKRRSEKDEAPANEGNILITAEDTDLEKQTESKKTKDGRTEDKRKNRKLSQNKI